jgi:hypothetical protein
MPEVVMKMLADQPLAKEPEDSSDLVDLNDGTGPLRVRAGQKVKTGGKASVTETLDGGRNITWVFVEALEGDDADKKMGFVSSRFLVPEATDVPTSDGFQAFSIEVEKEVFAEACYLQSALNNTNPAYLYALAFALSGDKWSPTHVKTSDPGGAYRFRNETWQSLLSIPEAVSIQADQIKFPVAQCIVGAVLAAKSASLLKGLITDRGLSAVDLLLAHLFADDNSFGSNAAARILQAEKDDKGQKSEAVIKAHIYPDGALRAAFFQRNADIFNADGSATIEQALEKCATKLSSGFSEVRKLADAVESNPFGKNIPSKPTDPILGGGGGGPTGTIAGVANGIDRRQFLDELANPALVKKSADMVKGEVGWGAPHNTKVVQLETAFNRAMTRGHSLAQALWSTSEAGIRGYYQGGANGTYSRPVTPAEFDDFKKTILPELLAGSNKSEELLGFIATGNASGSVAAAQFARGTPGGKLDTAIPGHPESYFHEGPFRLPF